MTADRTALILSLSLFASAGMASAQTRSSRLLADPAVVQQADGRVRDAGSGMRAAMLPVLYPSSHAANLLQLKNGDLVCVWFSGHWEGESGVAIVFSRLRKGSTTWERTRLIDRHDGESYQNPVLFQSPDGVLHLYHTTQQADAGEANSRVLEATSKDNGATWTAPAVLFEKGGSFTRDPLLVLPDGRWLMPLTYVTSKGIGEGAETNYSAMKLSSDGGRTWTECPVPNAFGKVQPSVVPQPGGQYIAFFRDRASKWIYRSTSSDGCKWTEPQATVLPNNNASIQAYALRNGHVVLAFNNSQAKSSGGVNSPGLRKPLSVAISEDAGMTWTAVRDIDTGRPGYGYDEQRPKEPGREEYSYPTVMQTSDGRIHVAYTYRRQTIREVSFQETWITQGRSEGLYQAPDGK